MVNKDITTEGITFIVLALLGIYILKISVEISIIIGLVGFAALYYLLKLRKKQ